MPSPLLFCLPGNEILAERLAMAVEAELGELSIRSFPDAETYVRLKTDPQGRDVAIVCTLPDPNEKILPLLFATGAARALGARQVGLVAPYLSYMRQDAVFHPGEAVSARIFADVLAAEAEWLITIDPHLHRIARLSDVYRIPATALHVADVIGTWVRRHVADPLIVGPDEESIQWAGSVAAAAHAPCVMLRKERLSDTRVLVTLPDIGSHDGRTPVLVDDIISTGQTMIAALAATRKSLPASRRAVCLGVHALFTSRVLDAILAAGATRVVTTNTIPHFSSAIDVVDVLASALREQWADPPGTAAPSAGDAPRSSRTSFAPSVALEGNDLDHAFPAVRPPRQ